MSSFLAQQNPAGEGESRDNDERRNRQMGRHAELFSDGEDEANSEDEQDFISNALIFFLGNTLQVFAQKVRNPRFTIHRTDVSPPWGLVNQSTVLLILMVQATNLASIVDAFPD